MRGKLRPHVRPPYITAKLCLTSSDVAHKGSCTRTKPAQIDASHLNPIRDHWFLRPMACRGIHWLCSICTASTHRLVLMGAGWSGRWHLGQAVHELSCSHTIEETQFCSRLANFLSLRMWCLIPMSLARPASHPYIPCAMRWRNRRARRRAMTRSEAPLKSQARSPDATPPTASMTII